VLQKAMVEVDEKGTEAAAATAVVVEVTSMPVEEEPQVIKIDHPFLFFIRDVETNTTLFMGRVTNP
jgi:serpin B